MTIFAKVSVFDVLKVLNTLLHHVGGSQLLYDGICRILEDIEITRKVALTWNTTWKVSVFGVFLVRIQSKSGKIRTRKITNTDTLTLWNRFMILLYNTHYLHILKCLRWSINNTSWFWQKQASRGVLRKSCSENMQQIFRRTLMPKCDFNKVTL